MGNSERFDTLCRHLEDGSLRVAEKRDGVWRVRPDIKAAILEGFREGVLTDCSGGIFSFFDKDNVLPRRFTAADRVRLVPGGTAVRRGAYIAPTVVIMPPAYVNIGAYVDEGTMIDSHVLVGSCAQVGKEVHLSAAAQLGGVLEPIGALPVILEDRVFIGGNCGIYEGTVVGEDAVIGSGTIITASTPIYDAVHRRYIRRDGQGRMVVPPRAVVVPGSRPLAGNEDGIHIHLPVIVKYKDAKTMAAVALESALRDRNGQEQ